MARVTVEDCVLKIPNRFQLVMMAAQRSRELSVGGELTVDRDNDKNPVVALREIADETIPLDDLEEAVVEGLQRNIDVDEIVEEEDDEAPTTAPIQDDEVPLLDAALEAVGVSIAAWVDPPPDDAAENAPANEWTVFASIKQRTTSTGSHGKIPEGGWEGVRDRLRNELVHEDAVPGHALLHYVDVREEEPDQKVDLDLYLAFSLLGFMHLERTMLGVTFILDEMAAARARERNALIAEVVEEIVEEAVEDAAAAKDKTV